MNSSPNTTLDNPKSRPETSRLSSSIVRDSDERAIETASSTETVQPSIGADVDTTAPESPVHYKATIQQKILMLSAVVIPMIGLAAAIVWLWQFGWMGWGYLAMMVGGWYIGGMGITAGYHRMLTHRSFEAHPVIRWFWTASGALSIQGSPLYWCAMHRRHHQLSDNEGDPHSPHLHEGGVWNIIKGFAHAHTGWLFNQYWEPPKFERYVPDLQSDPVVMHVHRRYAYYAAATFVLPTLIGGLATMSWQGALLGLLWGGFARIVLTQHITWSINSVCHIFGSHEYESGDHSTNNLIFGVIAHGEGWHNNHHAFPTSARHGLKWWQLDVSWIAIRTLQMVGLVWNVKLPSKRALDNKRIKR